MLEMKNRISTKIGFLPVAKLIIGPKGIKRAVTRTTLAIALIIVMAIAGVAVYMIQANSQSQPNKSQLEGTLNIAGSTLVFPLMNSWTFAYHQLYPGVTVNYNSIGSGGGIAQITARTVDIGATDAPLTSAQYSALPATVVTIPESISAVVPAYNLPGIKNGLKFTGDMLAKIFLGNITNWDDPAIASLNPGINLPDHAITVVHRSDGSGTMYAFTNFLADSNAQWRSEVGYSITPNWPTGIGCKGNEGVAGCIENTPYSIGPLEIAYVIENPSLISYGAVKNAAGNFILANLTNIAAAAQSGASVGLPAGNAPWTHVSIIDNIFNDTSATNAYPITTFTYLVTYQQQTSKTQGILVVSFLWWAVNSGQQAGSSLGYIPLPQNVVTLDDATIKSITYNGIPICTPSLCPGS
jgi:phosphate transport system substrate-binding protein